MIEFNEESFFKYLNNNIKEKDIDYYIKQYEMYNVLTKYINKSNNDTNSILNNLENKIYTVNNKTISDFEKIKIELYKIRKKYEKSSEKQKKSVNNEIKNLITIVKEKDFLLNEDVVFYAKKLVTSIQLKLDMNNTFYLALYTIFLDNYRNLELNYKEKKYELRKDN